MGYNTTVLVLNDALNEIAKDPEFGKKLATAVSRLCIGSGPHNVSAGMHCNAAAVIEHHHADYNAVVVVGGNQGTVLGVSLGTHDKLETLKQLAEQLGYSLRKKR